MGGQMAGKNAKSDEVEEQGLDETEEKSTLDRDAFPSTKVAKTAPARTPQRLSPIPEHDPGESKADVGSTGSSYSLCSVDGYGSDSSSTDSPHESHDFEDACAGIILNCLFCQFYDLCLTLPDTCELAISRICPSYKYLFGPLEPGSNGDWNCQCDFDCGCFDACQETGECLELAMEISEICYR
ncbi:myoD family inhibitor domain-containing protein 2 [Trichomycterus rosablanca]|uniref:myoD family inhibitor domain-containing protein 2 n=1 Tax=Trichomycterus rosablanca TaxID=2290929 RepID=UPI002F35BF22